MALRDPRLRGAHALRSAAIIATALIAIAIGSRVGHAQPSPAIERARELYLSAEAAMKAGRFDDAARDYGAAYELSTDPALLYKIGRANERAGKCDVALTYYARYLREGKPTDPFIALTNERIEACRRSAPGTGDGAPRSGPDAGPPAVASSSGPGTPGSGGSAATGEDASAAGTRAGRTTEPSAPTSVTPAPPATPAPDAAAQPPAPLPIPNNRQKVAWLLSGSAIALVTLGGVLAYAARSSESDVRDLYAGLAGQPLAYDAQTRKRYDDLIDDGHRFEHLSWAAFGLAGAATLGAALLFTVGNEEPAQHARVTPVITTRGAGVTVRF
jgi:tetratricopeptide (TPR) repeat protein